MWLNTHDGWMRQLAGPLSRALHPQDPQPALATQQAQEELQSTVVPFSLDKHPEGKRLIYSGR